MSAATIDITPDKTAKKIAVFLPLGVRGSFLKLVELLESSNIEVEALLNQIVDLGESIIQSGLDATIDGIEIAVEQLYEWGVMSKLGQINSFAQDGAEMGIQVVLNALKSLTPADVAKILGIALVLWLAPNVLVVGAPEFAGMVAEIAGKIWNMP